MFPQMLSNDGVGLDLLHTNSEGVIQAQGDIATLFMQNGMDVGALRPWQEDDGSCWITLNAGTPKERTVQIQNVSTLKKDEWIMLDQTVIDVAKPVMEGWGDLMGRGLRYSVPNGMGITVLQHQTSSDVSPAQTSMDGVAQSDGDRPVYTLESLPLPIIHKDGGFTMREIMTSRRSGLGVDLQTLQKSSVRVAEEVEKYLMGTNPVYTYAGGSIYGYRNYPNRITYTTMTAPSAGGWTPEVANTQILAMRQLSKNLYYNGPWQVYCSTAWDPYMDRDYSAQYPGLTLRQRIGRNKGLTEPKTLDYLDLTNTEFHILLVQMTRMVVEGVEGMGMTVFRWTEHGGFQTRFKVATIMVPRLRKDQNGSTGIVHGTTS